MQKQTILLGLIFAFASGPVQASSCESFGILGASIMDARQNGASLSRSLEALNALDRSSDEKRLLREATIEAFQRPQVAGNAKKRRATADFRGWAQRLCQASTERK